MRPLSVTLLSALLITTGTVAMADDSALRLSRETSAKADDAADALNLTFTAGVGAKPEYEGADEYEALPLIGFEYENRLLTVRSRGLGLEADFIPAESVEAGPLIRFHGGRDDDVDDDVVARLSEVGDSVEAGAFIASGLPVTALGLDDPAILTGRLTFAHDIAEGHGGFLVEGSVGVFRRFGERVRGAFGVSATFASADYMDAFFDVSAGDAAASGLPAFDADAGLKDIGLSAAITYAFSERWSATVIGAYTRLLGDAADSPIVDERGDPNQFFGGVAVNFRAY